MKQTLKKTGQIALLSLLTIASAQTTFAQRRGDDRRDRQGDHRRDDRRNDRRDDRREENDRWGRRGGSQRGNRWQYSTPIVIRQPAYRVNYSKKLQIALLLKEQLSRRPGYLLGSTYLSNNTADYDTLSTQGCGFSEVQIRTANSDVIVDHLILLLGNGRVDYVDVNTYFEAGTWSSWMDIQGGQRCIQGIVVVGTSGGRGYQGQVQIFGR